MSVLVTATSTDGSRGPGHLGPDRPGRACQLRNRRVSGFVGVARFGHIVRVPTGRLSPAPANVSYQWLRDDGPIDGETGRRYELAPETSAPGCGCG